MKKARLEIRLDEDDKLCLKKVAELENCTVTDLLDSYIQELVVKLKYKHNLKPNDSENLDTLD